MRGGAALLGLLAACADFSPGFAPGLTCGDDGLCPAPLVCEPDSQTCVASPPDAGGPPPLFALTTSAPVGGCAVLEYRLADPEGREVSVAFHQRGSDREAWRRLTQAASAPGESGTELLPTSPAGTTHRFHWNSTRDLAGVNGERQLRVVAQVRGEAARELFARVSVENARGLAATPLPEGGRRLGLADLDGDGRADRIFAGDDGVRVFFADGAQTTIASPSPVLALAVVQANPGGALDLAFTTSNRVHVALQISPGGFAAATEVASGNQLKELVGADVNLDGLADLVAYQASGQLLLVAQTREPVGFAAPVILPASTAGSRLAAGDLDGDGRTDLLLARGPDDPVLVYLQSPTPGLFFSPEATGLGADVVLADWTGDGLVDLVTRTAAGVVVHPVGPGRSFAVGTPITVQPGGFDHFAVADLDGDGGLDLLTSSAGQLRARLARDGELGLDVSPDGDVPANQLAVGDLDGDGRPDVVALGTTASTRLDNRWRPACEGLTSGMVGHALAVEQVQLPLAAVIVDVNRDGKRDVVTLLDAAGTLALMLGRGNGDLSDQVDVAEGAGVISALHAADLDGDGHEELAVQRGARVEFFASSAAGLVTAGSLALPSGTRDVVLVDVDGDGDPDVLARGEARVYLHDNVSAGTPGFAAAEAIGPPDFDPQAWVVGDVDGDQRVDLVLSDGARTALVRQEADGGFVLGPTSPSFFSDPATLIDLNGDGRPDVSMHDLQHVLIQEPAGGFREVLDLDVVDFSEGLQVFPSELLFLADRPAAPLLVEIRNPVYNTLSLARGALVEVDETRWEKERGQVGLGGALARGDLDGDAREDLVVAAHTAVFVGSSTRGDLGFGEVLDSYAEPRWTVGNHCAEAFATLPRLGTYGGLASLFNDRPSVHVHRRDPSAEAYTDTVLPVTHFTDDLAVADFDRDGLADVVVSDASRSLFLFRQSAPGVWAERVALLVDPARYDDLAVGDLDLDGWVDLVVGGDAENLAWLRNLAGQGFATPIELLGDDGNRNLLVHDVDGDGWPDIVGANLYASVVFRQREGLVIEEIVLDLDKTGGFKEPFLADLDGDGTSEVLISEVSRGGIYALAKVGGEIRGTLVPGTGGIDGRATLVDLDRDGRLDLVANSDLYARYFLRTPGAEVGFALRRQVLAPAERSCPLQAGRGNLQGDVWPDVLLSDQSHITVLESLP